MRIVKQEKPKSIRRDGWTPERREQFLDLLANGADVRLACARVALSREGAYRLRQRDPAFAREWRAALQTARICAEDAFLALLPERLRRAMAELPGECELHGAGGTSQDTVSFTNRV